MFNLTPHRLRFLHLLSITMVTPQMLVQGGVFHNHQTRQESCLRKSQKVLHELHKAGYISFTKYPVTEKGSFRRFYFLKPDTLEVLGKADWKFHKISEGLVTHDSITALFLVHMFRCSIKRSTSLQWHPSVEIEDKKCDGVLTLAKDGRIVRSLIIETDTGTHDHREIKDKLETYLSCLSGHPERKIVFLVAGKQRHENLKTTLQEVKNEKSSKGIVFFCPQSFPPDMELA